MSLSHLNYEHFSMNMALTHFHSCLEQIMEQIYDHYFHLQFHYSQVWEFEFLAL